MNQTYYIISYKGDSAESACDTHLKPIAWVWVPGGCLTPDPDPDLAYPTHTPRRVSKPVMGTTHAHWPS
jgi:hypothetical protein